MIKNLEIQISEFFNKEKIKGTVVEFNTSETEGNREKATANDDSKPSFDDLLANSPMDKNGGEMSAGEVYQLIGGKILSEHLRDPQAYNNTCALRVSRALNGCGVDLPNIPGETLTGADGRNYFYRAKDLYNWMTQSYGKPTSTTNYSLLSGNKGVYIMQVSYPARFGAWGMQHYIMIQELLVKVMPVLMHIDIIYGNFKKYNMKRFYFILTLSLLSIISCFGQNKTNDVIHETEQRELLKEYFLCVCIMEGFKDKQIDQSDISQAVYFDIIRYNPKALQEVKDYAKTFIESIEPSPIVDLGNKKAIIINCIEKYKSKELDEFIKSMDRYLLSD